MKYGATNPKQSPSAGSASRGKAADPEMAPCSEGAKWGEAAGPRTADSSCWVCSTVDNMGISGGGQAPVSGSVRTRDSFRELGWLTEG